MTVVLKSDYFFDPLRLIFFGTNWEKMPRSPLVFLMLNSFSWTAGNIRKGGMLLLSAILWNAATLACMCHEVYQQLAVTFVVTSRICVTEYLSGYARRRLYALSSGVTRVSCYTIWVRDMLHADVISHICHKRASDVSVWRNHLNSNAKPLFYQVVGFG